MKLFTFEKSVGAVVYRKTNEGISYLLLKYQGGHWSFPKGHMEPGETETDTLKREVEEETGLKDLGISPGFKAKSWYFYFAKDDEYINRKNEGKCCRIIKRVIFYLAETNNPIITLSHEHSEYKWQTYEEALSLITYDNDRTIFKKVHDFLISKL